MHICGGNLDGRKGGLVNAARVSLCMFPCWVVGQEWIVVAFERRWTMGSAVWEG